MYIYIHLMFARIEMYRLYLCVCICICECTCVLAPMITLLPCHHLVIRSADHRIMRIIIIIISSIIITIIIISSSIINVTIIDNDRRRFRSQTPDNMQRWKSRGGKSQRGEVKDLKTMPLHYLLSVGGWITRPIPMDCS